MNVNKLTDYCIPYFFAEAKDTKLTIIIIITKFYR